MKDCATQVYSTLEEGTPASRTMYTIDCPSTKPDAIEGVVTKHCLSLDQFLANKPIAMHTLEAFRKMQSIVPLNATIILDSGCGTGRSTRHLASLFPSKDYWVLGIDRSLVRLERNRGFRIQQQQQQQYDAELVWRGEEETTSESCANILWIRAELVDFWRLLLQHQDQHSWKVERHYLLYPNPYPKTKRLKSRWYGHPSFPLILQLGGEEIVLRSNWETYLQEFAQSVIIADEVWARTNETNNYAQPYVESARLGPVRRRVQQSEDGWSNFERKMDKVGEPTFELVLKQSS